MWFGSSVELRLLWKMKRSMVLALLTSNAARAAPAIKETAAATLNNTIVHTLGAEAAWVRSSEEQTGHSGQGHQHFIQAAF